MGTSRTYGSTGISATDPASSWRSSGQRLRFRLVRASGVLALAVSLLVALALAGPADALSAARRAPRTTPTGTSVSLGAIGFGSIVADSANGHVFVSGPTANVVDVFDLNGNMVTSIPSQYGAFGMVIHGSTLYVVQSTAGAIEQINLTTFADEGPLATGLVSPRWLAYAGGELWTAVSGTFGYSLTSVSLTGVVTNFPSPMYYGADLASSPGAPDMLFVAEDGLSPGSIIRLDVSSGIPVVAASNPFTDQENLEQLAVSPDGTRVIPASGYPYEFEELSASTLQPDGIIYPGQPYPSAVAVSPGDGGLLATGLENGYSSPDVEVDPLGKPAPIFTATTSSPDGTANVLPHGLALTDDGSKLYVITGDVFGSDTTLNVFTVGPSAPVVTPTTTSLSATPSNPQFGSPITFTATVTPTSTSASSPTGTVKFYVDGQTTPVATEPLVDDQATFTTEALSSGAHNVVATYSGDTKFAASTSTTLTETLGCSNTITGTYSGSLVVTSGSVCIIGARVNGSVVLDHGASADVENATINGSFAASGSDVVRMCSTAIAGNVIVGRASGLTVIGDPGDAVCAANTIGGSLILTNNTGGVEAIDNTAAHVVAANNSGPGPYPGDTTTITGNRT